MKKVTFEKAKKLISTGIPVKAYVNRDYKPVATLNDLENLKHLREEKVQDFELFYEPVNNSIPENAMEVSLDDAITLSYEGEEIYSLHDGNEIKFLSPNEIIFHFRSCSIQKNPCTFYWYVVD